MAESILRKVVPGNVRVCDLVTVFWFGYSAAWHGRMDGAVKYVSSYGTNCYAYVVYMYIERQNPTYFCQFLRNGSEL